MSWVSRGRIPGSIKNAPSELPSPDPESFSGWAEHGVSLADSNDGEASEGEDPGGLPGVEI